MILSSTYYAENYSSIIDSGLNKLDKLVFFEMSHYPSPQLTQFECFIFLAMYIQRDEWLLQMDTDLELRTLVLSSLVRTYDGLHY